LKTPVKYENSNYSDKIKMKIIIALNTSWNLINFRAGLIRALVAAGYTVIAVAPRDQYSFRLVELGCQYIPLPIDNKGTNPGSDIMLLWRYFRIMLREHPSLYLGYTIKPNIYGSLAAHALGIPVINNIAGLGNAFVKDSWLTQLVKILYKISLSRSAKVFFQNKDDMKLFMDEEIVRSERAAVVPGSGVDLAYFSLDMIKYSDNQHLDNSVTV
jgi:hypothetical protein